MVGLPVSGTPLRITIGAGSFDIYLTTAGEKTVLAGPLRIDPVIGDIIDLIALDNVDPAIADLAIIPLP